MQAAPATRIWGLAEAAIAWLTSQVLALFALVALLALGGWTASTPIRPGGHIGRATAQLASGQELVDDSIPLVWQMLTLLPLWIGLLGTAWLVAAATGRARPGWRIALESRDITSGVAAGILLQVPLIPVVYLIIQAVFGEIQPTGRALALTDQVDSVGEVVLIVAFIAIGAPVVEELFYRGLLQRALVDRFGPAVGITAGAIVFGAVHFSWVELPALALVGLVLGTLAWRTGRLGPAIVGHVTFNLFTLVNLLAAG